MPGYNLVPGSNGAVPAIAYFTALLCDAPEKRRIIAQSEGHRFAEVKLVGDDKRFVEVPVGGVPDGSMPPKMVREKLVARPGGCGVERREFCFVIADMKVDVVSDPGRE